MMVKNQTGHTVFTGGAAVPPDGDYHQVKDTPGTREAIKVGTLTQQRSTGKNDDDGGDDS